MVNRDWEEILKQTTYNNLPMEHWDSQTQGVVVYGLVMHAMRIDTSTIVGYKSRKKFLELARAEDEALADHIIRRMLSKAL